MFNRDTRARVDFINRSLQRTTCRLRPRSNVFRLALFGTRDHGCDDNAGVLNPASS